MKKITLLLIFIFTCVISHAQVLNENANWPNDSWDLSGSFETDPSIFTGNPTTDSPDFSYDEDEAGSASVNNIGVQSPIIDLTDAFNAGETILKVSSTYVLNIYEDETLSLQYWNADTSEWQSWGAPYSSNTTSAPTVDFCSGIHDSFESNELNISTFTSTQLSGFRYRIFYDDNTSWGWGICFTSPTIYSEMPPACPSPSNLSVTNITHNSADISWMLGSDEDSWEIVIQLASMPTPSSGDTTMENNPYQALSLTPDTSYKVYIRANCQTEGYSEWVSATFTTQEAPPEPGAFVFIQDNSVSMSGSSYALVDMNNDNMNDLIAASSSSVNINYQISGGFSNQTFSAPTEFGPSWSIAAGDIDGNGYNDLLYGAGSGVSFVMANNDGTAYSESYHTTSYVFSQRSNFVDINNDGNLDAFVCHDVAPNVYFLNDGSANLTYYQGESTPVPNGLGVHPNGGNYGTVWIDFDNDRDIDMFIAKCRGGAVTHKINELWRNEGNGVFVNVAPDVNMDDPVQTWSSAWADFDNDGDMDAYIGASSTADGSHKLMINNGNGSFTDGTAGAGVDSAPYGIENAPGDFNNDGWVDILTNGRILLNDGDGTFTLYDTDMPPSGAIGDVNGDGFLDVFRGSLYLNNGGNGNNYIEIKTVGTSSNYNGIGARIEVYTASGMQIRDVRSGEGFEYMSSLFAHFGLGTDTEIEQVVIYWPSGIVDTFLDPNINELVTFVEGESLGIIDQTLNDLTIFPNPAENVVYFKTDSDLSNKVATIFDVQGKRVLSSKIFNGSIDVSNVSPGIYVLRLEEKGRIMTRKLIIK